MAEEQMRRRTMVDGAVFPTTTTHDRHIQPISDPDVRIAELQKFIASNPESDMDYAAYALACEEAYKFVTYSERHDFQRAKFYFRRLEFWLEEFQIRGVALPSEKELVLTRGAYEEAVVMSVRINDHDAYERAFSQLKLYYTDIRLAHHGATYRQYSVTRFNLLKLLLQNKFSEFHSEVESLVEKAKTISTSWLMLPFGLDPNAYLRAFTGREIGKFLLSEEAVRDELSGSGMEPSNASSDRCYQEMLLFLTEKKLRKYVEKHCPEWKVLNGGVDWARRKRNDFCMKMLVVNQTIRYIMDLDKPDNWHYGSG